MRDQTETCATAEHRSPPTETPLVTFRMKPPTPAGRAESPLSTIVSGGLEKREETSTIFRLIRINQVDFVM